MSDFAYLDKTFRNSLIYKQGRICPLKPATVLHNSIGDREAISAVLGQN